MKKGTKPITITVDGEVPDGLTFDAGTWTLSGTPNETCNARTLTFTATNAEGSVSKDFTLTVNGVKPKITTSSLPQAVKGRDYSADVAATDNAPITWTAVNLPAGLSLDAETGAITGTPGQEGTFILRLTATNGTGQSAAKNLTLTVISAPEILDDIIPEGDANESYKYTMDYTGTSPVRFAVTAGTLPNGLMLNAKTGRISGTPTEAWEFAFTVTASNTAGAVSQEVAMTINAAPPRVTGSLKSGKVSREYSSGLKVREGSLPVTWSMTGTLPAGLEFDAETGRISGTPEEACKGYITVRAENSGGVHKKRVRLLIREDRTAEKSSLPEERTPEIPDDEHETLPITDDMAGRSSLPGNGADFAGGYVIVAELGVISCDMAGMYDFTVTLSDDAHEGAELVYLANSDSPSDDDIAEFFDADGEPVSTVPDDRIITLSIWLNPETVYTPVIAVKQ